MSNEASNPLRPGTTLEYGTLPLPTFSLPFPFPRGVPWYRLLRLERIQSCSVPKVRLDGQPTHLARCLLGLLTCCTCHTIPHPDQPEGGLTTRPLSPRWSSLPKAWLVLDDVWSVYGQCMVNVCSTSGPLRTTLQYLAYSSQVHLCNVLYSMHTTLLTAYVDRLGVLCPYHGVLYWPTMLRETLKKSTVYGIQHTKTGSGWSMLAHNVTDHHSCCSTAGRESESNASNASSRAHSTSTLEHAPYSHCASMRNETIKLHQTRGRGSMHRCTAL